MQPVILRAQAKEAGLKTYFTGKPCPSGHVAERQVSSGGCCECKKQASKQWHSQHADHNADYGKAYRAQRGEDLLAKKREYQRDWNAANKEEKRRRDAEYERQKRDERCPKFYAARTAIAAKRRAAELRATAHWCDRKTIEGMYSLAQVFRRAGLDIHVDHVVPLQSKIVCGLHTEDNLRLMPRRDNQSKSNRHWPCMP